MFSNCLLHKNCFYTKSAWNFFFSLFPLKVPPISAAKPPGPQLFFAWKFFITTSKSASDIWGEVWGNPSEFSLEIFCVTMVTSIQFRQLWFDFAGCLACKFIWDSL